MSCPAEKKREAEKERRAKQNMLIDQIFNEFAHFATAEDGKTKTSKLEHILKCCKSASANNLLVPPPGASVENDRPPTTSCELVAVGGIYQQGMTNSSPPAPHSPVAGSVQIDHQYLKLDCYKTIHDFTGSILYCCDGITRVNGLSKEEVMLRSPFEGFIHPDDVEYTFSEQSKMLSASANGMVSYRIVRTMVNELGGIDQSITYQISFGRLIGPNSFELLNVKIGVTGYEAYRALLFSQQRQPFADSYVTVPVDLPEGAASRNYSGLGLPAQEDDWGAANNAGSAILTDFYEAQPASNDSGLGLMADDISLDEFMNDLASTM